MPQLLRLMLRLAIQLAAFALAVSIVIGFFGRWHPAFDSFAHLRAHFGAALVLLAPLLFLSGAKLNAAAAVALGVGAIALTLPTGSFGPSGPVQAEDTSADGQPIYTLLQLNLYGKNPTPEQVISLIARERPDVITLNEVTEKWEEKLNLIKGGIYPYQLICRRERRSAVAIVSRRPFALGNESKCLNGGSLAIATIDFRGVKADVVALHLGWPWPYAQSAQLDQLSDELAQITKPAVMGADFNAVPWSFAAARVAAMSNMTAVDGIGRTWMVSTLPRWLRFAGLPIDYVLHSPGVRVHDARTLEPVGSDHWPVLMRFSIEPPPLEDGTQVTVGLDKRFQAR